MSQIRTAARVVARSVVRRLTSPRVALLFGEPFFWFLGRRGKKRHIEFPRHERVLALRLDKIGDAVLMTPFLRELRQHLPDAWITMVVRPSIRNLVELCPYVNEVLTYDRSVSGAWAPLQNHWRALQLAYRHLWARQFDLAVVPRWDADGYHASVVAYLSGAPCRVGYSETMVDYRGRGSPYRRRDPLFNRVLIDDARSSWKDNTIRHEVQKNLDVIRFLGGTPRDDRLELWVGEEDERFAEGFLRSRGVRQDDMLIALGPGAGNPTRMWPISNFVSLGAWLRESYHCRLVVLGGRGEEPLGDELQRQLGDMVVNAVGRATLRQTGALLQRCHLYIGNETGTKQLAAAAGVPVIEISWYPPGGAPVYPYSPERFSPWRVPHIILRPETALDECSGVCTSKQAHCILGITVEQVKEAVAKEVSRQSATGARKSVAKLETR